MNIPRRHPFRGGGNGRKPKGGLGIRLGKVGSGGRAERAQQSGAPVRGQGETWLAGHIDDSACAASNPS